MKPENLVKADFLTALCLTALGTAVVIESWRMPRLAERGVPIYSAPGVVPGLLGAVLLLLGLVLLLRSAASGGHRLPGDGGTFGAALRAGGTARLLLTLLLTLTYAAGLIGRLPYGLATGLFVFAFVALFEWDPADPPTRRIRHLGTAVLQAVLVAAGVSWVFERLFLVRLP
jgi:hypothetical protein